MGWTSADIAEGETVRSIITAAYEGKDTWCDECHWGVAYHPRVSGSEYTASYLPGTPAAHGWRPYQPTYAVLDYARSGGVAYLAVETLDTAEVWAGVLPAA